MQPHERQLSSLPDIRLPVTLSDLAKRLLSACRMIGAVALEDCCGLIERAGPGCSPSETRRLMAQLEDALAHVMTRLSGHEELQHSNAAD